MDEEVNNDDDAEDRAEVQLPPARGSLLKECIGCDWDWLQCSPQTKQRLERVKALLGPIAAGGELNLSACGCLTQNEAKCLGRAIFNSLKMLLPTPFCKADDDIQVRQELKDK